jgi:hypothetical protein
MNSNTIVFDPVVKCSGILCSRIATKFRKGDVTDDGDET